jgi:hypothetical protein
MVAEGAERLPRTGDDRIFFINDDYGITKVMPDTADTRAAVRSAKPVHGAGRGAVGVGGAVFGGNLGGGTGSFGSGVHAAGKDPERDVSDRGTRINVDPKAEGASREAQTAFAAAMARSDPAPAARGALRLAGAEPVLPPVRRAAGRLAGRGDRVPGAAGRRLGNHGLGAPLARREGAEALLRARLG